MTNIKHTLPLVLAIGLATATAFAQNYDQDRPSAEEIAKLGAADSDSELTPLGAERAGNADGSIPATAVRIQQR